ncbi:MAG TPA: DoxX family protein [Candidatus Paceibacterota bacterium]|nr:DoxX family protein [Candidatus Paceibacterota bacterium]
MFLSVRYSQFVIRIGLAAVFVWFGVDKFIHPQYWLDARVPQAVQTFAASIRIQPRDLINLIGLFEVLVALSLVTGYFMRYFAVVACAFLLANFVFNGIHLETVRDLGLIGGLVALVIWPERTYS